MQGLRALIFDLDGTLADTEEVHRTAFNATFKAFGLSWTWDPDLYRRLVEVSGGRERLRHFIETADPPGGTAMLPRIAELHDRKTQLYAKMVDDRQVRLRPGVERLIEEARSRGLKIALVATTSPENVDSLIIANLDFQGLEMFDVIVRAGDATAKKPAPDVYLLALQRLDLPARCCIAFEDSANGLKAAMAAGLRTIVTPSVYSQGQDFTGAFAVFSHLGDTFEPYEHLGGIGESERMVTVGALRRWLADDDDLRSLLTIGGRSIY